MNDCSGGWAAPWIPLWQCGPSFGPRGHRPLVADRRTKVSVTVFGHKKNDIFLDSKKKRGEGGGSQEKRLRGDFLYRPLPRKKCYESEFVVHFTTLILETFMVFTPEDSCFKYVPFLFLSSTMGSLTCSLLRSCNALVALNAKGVTERWPMGTAPKAAASSRDIWRSKAPQIR